MGTFSKREFSLLGYVDHKLKSPLLDNFSGSNTGAPLKSSTFSVFLERGSALLKCPSLDVFSLFREFLTEVEVQQTSDQ